MATEISGLIVHVESKGIDGAVKSLDRLTTSSEKTERAVNKSTANMSKNQSQLRALSGAATRHMQEMERQAARLDRVMNGTANTVKSFIKRTASVVGVGLGVQSIIQAADSYTVLQNKLQNVSSSARQTSELMDRLFDVANKTRMPIQETAQSFIRFDMALKNLGKSQDDSLSLTEVVNKMLITSGATATEAGSALLQLSQAFNKGKLDGDEFRTVMELMPSAADAIAKRLKVTRGELLKLAPEGKITAQVMFDAFMDASKDIDYIFGKTVSTISQAMVILRNNATKAFGEINDSLGLTESISKVIIFLADNIKVVAVAATTAASALLVAFGAKTLGAIASATRAVWLFTAAIAANPIGLLVIGITALVSTLALFNNKITSSIKEMLSFGGYSRAVWDMVKEGAITAFETIKERSSEAWEASKKGASSAASWMSEKWSDAVDFVTDKTDGWVDSIGPVFDDISKMAISGANTYIGAFVGAFKAIIAGWRLFPAAMGDLFYQALDIIIDIAEEMANVMLSIINKITSIVDKSANFFGMDAVFGSQLEVSFKRVENKYAGAVTNLAGVIKEEFTEALNGDYIGSAAKTIIGIADSVTKSLKDRVIANKKNGITADTESKLRGSGAPSTTSPGKSGGKKSGKAKETLVEALANINEELDQQFSLLGKLGREYEIYNQLQQYQNTLAQKGFALTQQQTQALIGRLETLQKEKSIHEELNRIYDETIGAQQALESYVIALDRAFAGGILTLDAYTGRLVKAGIEMSNIRLLNGEGTLDDVMMSSLGQIIDQYDGLLMGLSDSFGGLFTSITDGFADSIGSAIMQSESLGEAINNVAKNALATMINSLVKIGIQWAINTALARSYNIVAAGGGGFGGIFGGVSKLLGMAHSGIDSVPQTGTWLLQKGERVVTSETSAKLDNTLDQVRQSNTGSSLKVNVINNASGVEHEVRQISPQEVEIIAKRVVQKEAAGVIANDLRSANSTTSKAMNASFKVQRNR